MKQNIMDKLLREWKQMTAVHRIRFIICLNLMIFLTVAFPYYETAKMVFMASSYGYATTHLFQDNQTMIAVLNDILEKGQYSTLFIDVLQYLLCVVGLCILATKKRLFRDTDEEHETGGPPTEDTMMEPKEELTVADKVNNLLRDRF